MYKSGKGTRIGKQCRISSNRALFLAQYHLIIFYNVGTFYLQARAKDFYKRFLISQKTIKYFIAKTYF